MINGINMCDSEAIKSVKSGTVVKTWNITILSTSNESIIVSGETFYENLHGSDWILLTAIPAFFIFLSIILFILKYKFKKNIHISLPILSLLLGIFLWVGGYFSSRIFAY
jgi:phosphate starvation-inducible membrane PsiE